MPDTTAPQLAPLLAWFYAGLMALNLTAAVHAAWARQRRAVAWLALAAVCGWMAWRAAMGLPPEWSPGFKVAANAALGPMTLSLGSLAALGAAYVWRRWIAMPWLAWLLLNASLLWLGLSLADRHFATLVARPDNVPIVAMVWLLGIFTWLGVSQAVRNDRRLAEGRGPEEYDYRDEVLVWPDVVYLELIGTVVGTVVLVVWSLLLRAPLEQPANPAVTPNPSKAPWYFLGLQEMLVYFPPWMAGVVLPILIIVGLMAIPYLDRNRQGNGYYTIAQRPMAFVIFQFGFLQLWILLILIGTFLRGPNWSFFGLYEAHDAHKLVAAPNVNLSSWFWTVALGRPLPLVPADGSALARLLAIAWRELPGLVLGMLYYGVLPIAFARTCLRNVRQSMGRWRYIVAVFLLLTMLLLPLKMMLNWNLHVNYLVSVPEWSFAL